MTADLDGAVGLVGDITSADHRDALAAMVQERFGRLDILVNNAGINDDGPLEDQTLADLTTVIDVNLVAVMDMCRVSARLLFASEHASVINIASMYGVIGSKAPMAAYNATKGAIVNFTRHLAAQWGHRGVRVNTLSPAYFPSEMTGPIEGSFAEGIIRNTVLRRVPGIEELDGPLLFLASDASSYVTGHNLVVDGGWTVI